MDYDALTGKGGKDTDSVLVKRKRSLVVRSRNRDNACCSKKCFVITAVALFLFVTFVSLPAGAFLIIHGNRKDLMGFKLAGGLVVSIPVVIGFLFCLTLCLRRKWTKKFSFPHANNPQQI